MADTATKSESKKTKASAEEPLMSLPAGHPQAGYVGPDLSYRRGAGQQSDEDEQAYQDAVAEHEAQVEAVAKAEHEVAKAEREEELKEAEKTEKEAEKK